MSRLGLAFRAFWRILTNAAFAKAVEPLLAAQPAPASMPVEPKPAPAPAAQKLPARSEALTLLAVLQREARLIDFIKEPIATYSDAQVGAAVRDIHRDCAAAVDRMFALKPLLDQPEGSSLEIPPGFDPARYRLTGHVAAPPPLRGTLTHPGWEATQVSLPDWSGSPATARIVAPAEVDVPAT